MDMSFVSENPPLGSRFNLTLLNVKAVLQAFKDSQDIQVTGLSFPQK